MRIRTVKPEYWQHRMHKRLCLSASALGSAVLNYVDDEGRGIAEGELIRGMVCPCVRLEKTVDALLAELAAVDWLVVYEAEIGSERVRVFQILAFELHQVIQRPGKSALPPPPPPWKKKAVMPQRTAKNGEVIPAKGRWTKDQVVSLIDRSLSDTNNQSGMVNESSLHGENGESGIVNDESMGKEGRKGKEGTEGGSTRARAGEAAGMGAEEGKPPEGGTTCSNLGAVPTVEEVVAAGERCVPTPAPRAYCVWLHGFFTSHRKWHPRGFLIDWPWELGTWWRKDEAAFLAGSHISAPGSVKNGAGSGAAGTSRPTLPGWRQIEVLEERIGEHVANAGSNFHDKKAATAEKRAELAGLREQLAKLKAGGVA